jgi:hypothetical protein
MYDPLPPDVARLRVVQTFLRLMLEAVTARIEDLEAGRRQRGVAWRLQHLPRAGGAGHGVLHDAVCWITDGAPLNRSEAELALRDASVEACSACQPGRELGSLSGLLCSAAHGMT